MPAYFITSEFTDPHMYFTQLRVILRNLWRQKLYSFINIFGLALGIAAFLLILEYISFEKSVNGFHKDLGSTYRLINQGVKGETWPQIEPGWATRAAERIPEITDYCRFENGVAGGIVRKTGGNNDAFRETNIGYAEGNFFRFFSFPVISGDADALKQPNTVFLNQAAAKKYFGNVSAIGQQLELSNQFGTQTYTVAGLFSNPENSDISFDMVFSYETLKIPANLNGNGWADPDNISSQYIYTFFKLSPLADYRKIEKKLTELRNELGTQNDGLVFRLQPLRYVHLSASLNDTFQTFGNLKYIYILGIIAMFILVIAWFNYINLSTSNALKRAGEVGVRKVIGASRTSLILQFLGEAVIVNLMGLSIALGLVYLLQPYFNGLIGKNLSLSAVMATPAWLAGMLLLVAGSLLTGGFTAYSLSGFNPIETLKGRMTNTGKGVLLRKGLVVAQFTISIVLILTTAIIFSQLQYMQQKALGVNTAQVLVIRGPEVGKDSTYTNRRGAFLNGLSGENFVEDYSISGAIPGNGYNFSTAGFTQPGSKSGDELKTYSFAIIDEKFLSTYEIPLKAGRNFTGAECDVEWNANDKVLINERALQELGFSNTDDVLNTRIQWDERQLQVIGVVKEYHHNGLQRPIDPMIYYPQHNNGYINVRLNSNNLSANLKRLEKLYKASFPGNPFEYFFADENFNKQYVSEKQYGLLFTAGSVWAIVIACLGLFGLTTFTVESRTREVGIRKVLGAGVFSISKLISLDFLKLIVIAALMAFPVAWFAMHKWLQDFAYRVTISPFLFLMVGALAVLIALFTISFKAIGAAMANPVSSLRSE